MKKLLLAPFLLASLFSFGGELKANPGSPYEIPNTKLNISDPKNLNNNNSRQYLLKGSLLEYHRFITSEPGRLTKPLFIRGHNFLEDIPFHNLIACQSAKRSLKDLVEKDQYLESGLKKWRFVANCSPGERRNKSKYEIPEYYKFQVNYFMRDRDGEIDPVPFLPNSPAHFSDKSSCELNGRRAKNQISGWNITDWKSKSKYICIKTSTL